MRLVLTILALAGLNCATQCIMSNKVAYIGTTQEIGKVVDGWTCEAMDWEMATATRALRKVTQDVRFQYSAPEQDLSGWQLVLHPTMEHQSHTDGQWYHGYWLDGRVVAGHTDCPQKRIHVGAGYEVRLSALAHELAHVFQRCTPYVGAKDAREDHFHAGWHDIGIYRALDAHQTQAVK
jgi:hypothetical protein